MKSGIRYRLALTLIVTLAASCKDDESPAADLAVRDGATSADLSVGRVGIACGSQTCDVGSICCSDSAGAACGTTCDKTFTFGCDGPEDCTGTGEVCCLTIDDPSTTSNRFVGECKAKSACDPTLNAAANPIVTAVCHDNANCAAYHPILAQCCYNEGRPNVTFCALPFSNDGGVNVVCQN